ncbi:hypothetical protein Noda2021_10160 [Candidatus Dependentiae bacterium Noda2021]|nr:hypothetical protein Noda2021_10160 [Candidatus Dependentiae bacterium Noda2021]
MNNKLVLIARIVGALLVPAYCTGHDHLASLKIKNAAFHLQSHGKKIGQYLLNWSKETHSLLKRATKDALCCVNDYVRNIEPEKAFSQTLEVSTIASNPLYWPLFFESSSVTSKPWQELCTIIDNDNWLYLKAHQARAQIIFNTFETQLNNYHEEFPDRKTILDALTLRAQNRVNELKKEAIKTQSPSINTLAKVSGWALLTGLSTLATIDTINEKDYHGWQGTAALLAMLSAWSFSNSSYQLNTFLNTKKYVCDFLHLNQYILDKLNHVTLAEDNPEVIS